MDLRNCELKKIPLGFFLFYFYLLIHSFIHLFICFILFFYYQVSFFHAFFFLIPSQLPLKTGIGLLDENKVTRIRLGDNNFEGYSSAFVGYGKAKDIVEDVRRIGEEGEAKWNEVRVLVVGDAAVGKFF